MDNTPKQHRSVGATAWLAVWTVLAAALLLSAVATPRERAADTGGSHAAIVSREVSLASREAATNAKPIEQVRLGERVLASAAADSDLNLDPDIVPELSRVVRFHLTKADGSVVEVDLLRPLIWIELLKLEVGSTIELSMPEMGAVGLARVVAIDACPDVVPGEGAVVTGLFRHRSAEIVEVGIAGDRQPIQTTASHPFWSEDREDFIPAAELKPGERLRSEDGGTRLVETVSARGPPRQVYNIEVSGEHTYYVGAPDATLGEFVWVHNTCVYREVVDGELKYVGITNNFDRRAGEHLRNADRTIEQIKGLENIDYRVARAIEHRLIEKYGRVRDKSGNLLGGQLANLQRGIDPRKLAKYKSQLAEADRFIAELGL